MAKPFSIQAPEDIAKEYAGNKQMIAQAAQMGVVDPTAAVLAGMFIDRMRSAQVMEAGQQPSVAQQVLGGQPSAPPAGLGATPQALPPMEAMPPQEMPQPEMPQPEMGMAAGGLTTLPLPDTMFDESTNGGFNDGYAGGGMVAFADGGSTDGGLGSFIEQTVRKLDPNIQITGRARTPARNAQLPGSVSNSYHLIDAARDIRTPEGMKKSDFIAQLKSVFGSDYDVLPSAGNSVHVEPGPKLGQKVRAGARPSSLPTILQERDINTAEGRGMSMEDSVGLAGRMLKDPEEYAQAKEEARARFAEMRSPEEYEKQRKSDMYMTLAEIGFNMASSKAPSVLQAIGEAAAAAMPGARADKKERKALKDRALDGLLKLGAEDRAQAKEVLSLGTDIYRTGLQQEQAEQELAFKKEVSKEELAIAKRQLEIQLLAATAKGTPDAASQIYNDFKNGTPAQQEVIAKFFAAKSAGSAGADMATLFPQGDSGATGEKDPFEGFSASRN